MKRMRARAAAVALLAGGLPLSAEIPLPDATLYGRITTRGGEPVAGGVLKARIRRGGSPVIEVAGSFKEAEGGPWFIVNIPLETAIGAPGPSGTRARAGDALEALLLDGLPVDLQAAVASLEAGAVHRVDAVASPGQGGLLYFRGDCSPDLTLNISDPLRLLNFLFVAPGAPPCLAACDTDGGGGLNISDAIALLAHLFLGGPEPAPPGPRCGVDPHPSSLGCVQSACAA